MVRKYVYGIGEDVYVDIYSLNMDMANKALKEIYNNVNTGIVPCIPVRY